MPARINSWYVCDEPALHTLAQAAIEGRVEEISTLICHGLDIDAVDDEGNTALHLASRHGRAAVARRLAEAFPNEELRNRRGFTALDEAIQAQRMQCTSCIRNFADIGKAHMLKEHCNIEKDRLEKLRRKKVQGGYTLALIGVMIQYFKFFVDSVYAIVCIS